MQPIVHPQQLLSVVSDDSILIDASNHVNARGNYQKQHLKGALFVDTNTQLATIHHNVAIGGRHPLPSLKQFTTTVSQLGITKESHVIIYDDKHGANAAARFWWMLKAIGHKKVQVLNGGFQAALRSGFPTDDKVVTPRQVASYTVTNWQLPLATIQEVEVLATANNSMIIDVREAKRYQGITEPIDAVAGHIPGAINLPYTTNLDDEEHFLPAHILKIHFNSILKNIPSSNVVIHCGSGVTACHTLLAMSYAGLQLPKLYVGSWSEWSRSENPIITKK